MRHPLARYGESALRRISLAPSFEVIRSHKNNGVHLEVLLGNLRAAMVEGYL